MKKLRILSGLLFFVSILLTTGCGASTSVSNPNQITDIELRYNTKVFLKICIQKPLLDNEKLCALYRIKPKTRQYAFENTNSYDCIELTKKNLNKDNCLAINISNNHPYQNNFHSEIRPNNIEWLSVELGDKNLHAWDPNPIVYDELKVTYTELEDDQENVPVQYQLIKRYKRKENMMGNVAEIIYLISRIDGKQLDVNSFKVLNQVYEHAKKVNLQDIDWASVFYCIKRPNSIPRNGLAAFQYFKDGNNKAQFHVKYEKNLQSENQWSIESL